ncbi:MAG: hypothetical protein HDT19_08230 [Oscillibacter sp.]|nr:hypothetical protein [Oscillibacter sp.]
MRPTGSMIPGTILLTGANLLLRISGMAFQVYLSGRIGAGGVGLLQLALSVRGLAFTVGSAGVRTCAMYLTAGALGRERDTKAVMDGCFRYSALCSGLAMAALWCAAPSLAREWMGSRGIIPCLRLYAVFLPVSCLGGVLTGYFTANGRIRTLVAVEFLEQGLAVAGTFLLLERWAGENAGRACTAVAAGSCIAGGAAFLVLWVLCRRELPERAEKRPPYGDILKTALPLGAADGLRAGLNTLENLLIPKRLALYAETVDALADYGVLHGMVFPAMMFPAAALFSLAELLVPEFSRCAAGNRWPRVRYLTRRGLRTSLAFSLLAAGILLALGPVLGDLLYHTPAAGRYLRLYAPFVPILYTDAIVDAMCKGLGQQSANARYNLLTSFLDVVFLWTLLPRWGLGGYYVSFAVTHLLNFGLSLRRLLVTAYRRQS